MAPEPVTPRRALEIDVLRTVAILMMVTYHLLFNLRFYWGMDIEVFTGFWKYFARATGSLFLLLVGISAVLSARARGGALPDRWLRGLKRGGTVLLGALGITIATYLFDPDTYIRFGVLHCIGFTMLLLPLLVPLRERNAILGLVIIAVGFAMKGTVLPTELLLPFHIVPPGFRTIDYYPMLPWSGVVLIGAGLGSLLYVRLGWSGVPARGAFWQILTWPGRHALLVYLIHQPLLLLLLRHTLGPMTYGF